MRWLRYPKHLINREDGTTSVEYCVMLAFVLVLVMVGLTSAGGGVSGWWANITGDLDTHGF